jgi:hypothetical protein
VVPRQGRVTRQHRDTRDWYTGVMNCDSVSHLFPHMRRIRAQKRLSTGDMDFSFRGTNKRGVGHVFGQRKSLTTEFSRAYRRPHSKPIPGKVGRIRRIGFGASTTVIGANRGTGRVSLRSGARLVMSREGRRRDDGFRTIDRRSALAAGRQRGTRRVRLPIRIHHTRATARLALHRAVGSLI